MTPLTPIRRKLTQLIRLPVYSARQRRAARVGDLCIRYLDGELSTQQTRRLFAELRHYPHLIDEVLQAYEIDRMLHRHYGKPATQ